MSTTTIKSEEQSAMPAGCRSVAERIAELEKDPKKKAALDAARQRIKEHGWGDELKPIKESANWLDELLQIAPEGMALDALLAAEKDIDNFWRNQA